MKFIYFCSSFGCFRSIETISFMRHLAWKCFIVANVCIGLFIIELSDNIFFYAFPYFHKQHWPGYTSNELKTNCNLSQSVFIPVCSQVCQIHVNCLLWQLCGDVESLLNFCSSKRLKKPNKKTKTHQTIVFSPSLPSSCNLFNPTIRIILSDWIILQCLSRKRARWMKWLHLESFN